MSNERMKPMFDGEDQPAFLIFEINASLHNR